MSIGFCDKLSVLRVASLLEVLGENPFPYLSQLLEGTCSPQFVVPSSIFRLYHFNLEFCCHFDPLLLIPCLPFKSTLVLNPGCYSYFMILNTSEKSFFFPYKIIFPQLPGITVQKSQEEGSLFSLP